MDNALFGGSTVIAYKIKQTKLINNIYFTNGCMVYTVEPRYNDTPREQWN